MGVLPDDFRFRSPIPTLTLPLKGRGLSFFDKHNQSIDRTLLGLSAQPTLWLFLFHHADKPVKQIAHFMWAGRCFRMPLKTERRFIGARHALQRAVE